MLDDEKLKDENPGAISGTTERQKMEQAKAMGFTGVRCSCGSYNSIPNGTCALCTNCNSSIGGCS